MSKVATILFAICILGSVNGRAKEKRTMKTHCIIAANALVDYVLDT